jgi:hypothetical protein
MCFPQMLGLCVLRSVPSAPPLRVATTGNAECGLGFVDPQLYGTMWGFRVVACLSVRECDEAFRGRTRGGADVAPVVV